MPAIQIVSLGLVAISLATFPCGRLPAWWCRAPIIAAAVAVPLLYLLPLPLEWWAMLPGRSTFAAEYQQVGITAPWLSVSLDAPATERAVLSLFPQSLYFWRRSSWAIAPAVASASCSSPAASSVLWWGWLS